MLLISIGWFFLALFKLSQQQILQETDIPLPDRRFYSYPLYDDDDDESNCNGCLFHDAGYYEKSANNLPPRYGVRDSQDNDILQFNNLRHEPYTSHYDDFHSEPYNDDASYNVRHHAPIDTAAFARTPYMYSTFAKRLRPFLKPIPKHRMGVSRSAHNRKYMSYILGKLKSDVTASRKSDATKPIKNNDTKASNGTLTHERKLVLSKLLKLLKLFTFVQIQSLAANQSTSTTMKTLDTDIFGQLNDNNSTNFNPSLHQKLGPNQLYVTDKIKKLSDDDNNDSVKPDNHRVHHHHTAIKDADYKSLNIKNIDDILDSLSDDDSVTSVPPLDKKDNKTKQNNIDKQNNNENIDLNFINKTSPFIQNGDKKSDKINDSSTDYGLLDNNTNNELIDKIATSVDSFGGLLDELISNKSLDYIWHIQNGAMRSNGKFDNNGNYDKSEDDENDDSEASSFADMLLELVNMFNTTTSNPTPTTKLFTDKKDVNDEEVTYDIVPPLTENDEPSTEVSSLKAPTWKKPSFQAPTSNDMSNTKNASIQEPSLRGPPEITTAAPINATSEKPVKPPEVTSTTLKSTSTVKPVGVIELSVKAYYPGTTAIKNEKPVRPPEVTSTTLDKSTSLEKPVGVIEPSVKIGEHRGKPFIPKASLDDDDDEFVLPPKPTNETTTSVTNNNNTTNATKVSGEDRSSGLKTMSATEAKLDKKITQVFAQVVNELDADNNNEENLFGSSVVGPDVVNETKLAMNHGKLVTGNNLTFAGEINERLSAGLLPPVKHPFVNMTLASYATNKVDTPEKIPQAKEIFDKLSKNISANIMDKPDVHKALFSNMNSAESAKTMLLSEEQDVEEGSGHNGDKDSYANAILMELRHIFKSIKTSKFPAENENMFHAYINELMKSPTTNQFLQSIHKNRNTSATDSLDPDRPLTEKFIDLIKFADLNKKVIPFYGKREDTGTSRTILDQLSTINDDNSRTNMTTSNTGDIPAADPAESRLTFARVLQAMMKKVREHEVKPMKKEKLTSSKFQQILKNLK